MPRKATPPPTTPKSHHLQLEARPGVSEDRLMTDLLAQGKIASACTVVQFAAPVHGEVSLTDLMQSLRQQGEAVNRGDLRAAESMLNAQAVALNAIFGELARRAAAHMGGNIRAAETYLRLALKAQSQSRATVETLAAIKNPPVVFARQANIAHGPQQVNNGAPAHPGQSVSEPNEVFEEASHARPQLDAAATPATSRAHSQLEPMEASHRPAHG